MQAAVRVFDAPDDVAQCLAQLGLTRENLLEAVRLGEAARRSATAHDPASASGFDMWRYSTRALRDILVPKNWHVSRQDGLERAVSPDGRLHLIVMLGDAATGIATRIPTSKYPRGPSSVAFIEGNVTQRLLHGGVERISRRTIVPQATSFETWALLHHSTEDEVRCELSLPAGIGDDDRVHDWSERILLPPTSSEPVVEQASTPDAPPEVEVQVRRRSTGG
jgi:hypothetical protein